MTATLTERFSEDAGPDPVGKLNELNKKDPNHSYYLKGLTDDSDKPGPLTIARISLKPVPEVTPAQQQSPFADAIQFPANRVLSLIGRPERSIDPTQIPTSRRLAVTEPKEQIKLEA